MRLRAPTLGKKMPSLPRLPRAAALALSCGLLLGAPPRCGSQGGGGGNSTHYRCDAHACVAVPPGATKPSGETWYGTKDCNEQCRGVGAAKTSPCPRAVGLVECQPFTL